MKFKNSFEQDSMFLKISTVLLIPTLLVQGYFVKKKMLRLDEAEGDRQGRIGEGKALSMLILGDSAAAGVGVKHQQDALLGGILNQLQHEFEVYYQLEAQTGDTTLQVLARTQKLANQSFDVVITSVGVNDVTRLISPQKWIDQQHQFYQAIETQFSPQQILVTGVPPMHLFPALPNPLGWLFGQYSKAMNANLIQLVQTKTNYQLIQFDLAHFKALNLPMAEDGFHPSREIYQLWAKQVADQIQIKFK